MLNVLINNKILRYAAVLLSLLLIGNAAASALAANNNEEGGHEYLTTLRGAAEVPMVEVATSGTFELTINKEKTTAMFNLEVRDGKAITEAHLHCGNVGENGPVFAWLSGTIPGGFDVNGTLASATLSDANILASGSECAVPITNIADLMTAIDAGDVYVNVHSVEHPSGVVRGQLESVVGNVDDDTEKKSADKDTDGYISVAEGVPFYGGIVDSLTTSGNTSSTSALALDRFPVASNSGTYTYERTFKLSDATNLDDVHVVIHGADIDQSGMYDGEKQSSIAAGVPFEATVPVACGVLYKDADGSYKTNLSELNSTGVTGNVEIKMVNGEAVVYLTVANASPNLAHAQHLHQGGSNTCPPNTVGIAQFYSGNGGNEEVDKGTLPSELRTYKSLYSTAMTGQDEVPAVTTPSFGSALIGVSMGEDKIDYTLSVENGENVTAAHLHCGLPGENGPVVATLFDGGPVDLSGILATGTIKESDVMKNIENCSPGINTLSHLVQAIREGQIYVNVHSTTHPTGMIRGQLMAGDAIEVPLENETPDEDVDSDNTNGHYQFPSSTNFDPFITLSPYYLNPDEIFKVRGEGFVPNEEVTLTVEEMTEAVKADNDGKFVSLGFTVPITWIDSVLVTKAIGSESAETVTANVFIGNFYPVVTPSSYYFPNQGSVNFDGQGFAPNESVSLMLRGEEVAKYRSDGAGDFGTGSIIVPLDNGRHEYRFTGMESGVTYPVTIFVGQ